MDDALRAELDQLCAMHTLGADARRAVERLVEALTDPRLAATAGPSPNGDAWIPEADPYEDLGPIGAGGMGEVRRARERALGRVVAMKVLRRDGDEAWFAREAALTASLDHPGVPPIFAWGRRADGRPFFTLREVHGRTLRELLDEPGALPLRRGLEALRRVAETVASAHARGVVHRDLKPDNVMLGEFGEVWVLDWGIAGKTGETLAPGVGSPRYMAPEQAEGQPLGPTADVWALGALLYEILTGRPAFPGNAEQARRAARRGLARFASAAPAELQRLVTRCLSVQPGDRPADAATFAAALGAFLDGDRAREEATVTLDEARTLLRRVEERRAQARGLRATAAATLAAVPRWAPATEKQGAWEQEEEAAQEEREAEVEEAEAAELARAALQRCPELDAAHVLLADHYRRRLDLAERAGDPAALRLEAQLRVHDTGAHAAWIAGDGAVTLVTDPPGARVVARPYLERGRRLVPGEARDLGVTPLREVPLPRGSWLLEITAEGRLPVRYPVFLGRCEQWDGVPPGETVPTPIRLPRPGELGPDEVYVPAGWARIGADHRANHALPGGRVWLDGFVIDRFATTNARWLDYVNTLQGEDPDAARAAVPRERAARIGEQGVPLFGLDAGRWFLKPDGDGDEWLPDWPVLMVDHGQAAAYAAWRTRTSGQPWRFLRGIEHEKAARGADGRLHAWGNGYDASFAGSALSFADQPKPVVVTAFPLDESPYGVRGLCGTVRTWTSDVEPDGRMEVRGSYWNAGGEFTGRAAARFLYPPHQRGVDVGIRLARSFG